MANPAVVSGMHGIGWSPSTGEWKPGQLLKPLVDPSVWYPEEMATSEAWIYRLSNAENDEIESAVAGIEASGKRVAEVGMSDFPLPRLGPVLDEVKKEVMRGRGFALLRGVRLDRMTRAQGSIAFWGVGVYLGTAIPQTTTGHVLTHVMAQGGKDGDDRSYTHNAAIGYHCDSCDVLALGVVGTGRSGGEHRITSTATLYNELLKVRPDLVKELGGQLYRCRAGDAYGKADPWIVQSCFNFEQGYFSCRSVGNSLYRAQKFPQVPRLTESQREAVELFKKMAPDLSIVIPFERGDFFFVNNHTAMHSRTAFEDGPGPQGARHLMRLWINNGLRPLPSEILDNNFGPPLTVDRVEAILEMP
jgi:hypothetical protein